MARIRPDWTPTDVQSLGDFTIGHQWSASVPVTISGVWYYYAGGDPEPTILVARLYDVDSQSLLVSGSTTTVVLGWGFVAFTAPFDADPDVDYVSAIETDGEFSFSLDQLDDPITDPTGIVTIPAVGGRFRSGFGYPDQTGTFMHGTDTEFSTASIVIDSSGAMYGAAYAEIGTTKFNSNMTAGYGTVSANALSVSGIHETRAVAYGGAYISQQTIIEATTPECRIIKPPRDRRTVVPRC